MIKMSYMIDELLDEIGRCFFIVFLIHPSSSFLQVVGPLRADQAIAPWMLPVGLSGLLK